MWDALDQLHQEQWQGEEGKRYRGMLYTQRAWLQALVDQGPYNSVSEVLDDLGIEDGPLTQAKYDEIRRKIREKLLAKVVFAETDLNEQRKILYQLMEIAPEGSKGAIFEKYWQQRLERDLYIEPEGGDSDAPRDEQGPGRLQGLEDRSKRSRFLTDESHPMGRRSVDAMGRYERGSNPSKDAPPTGDILIDTKAGPGAFKEEQFLDYLELIYQGGAKLTDLKGNDYAALVFLFDTVDSAEKAAKRSSTLMDKFAEQKARQELPGATEAAINKRKQEIKLELQQKVFFGSEGHSGMTWQKRSWNTSN